ncbi:peptide/nickel transport system substrate-binding protein [Tistlia consotensis]|uniref:Peptide/nickel transport system substrate-binding protein n=1 Tax=Tistlia consotensis USBA 355 TaxID=560819 RepID=A0A1Y6CRT8_9PROT|nr:ABC transporter substrate-binding protein [Tistlia consotensis]SMF68732.1 peptide/nickel transport system substrate-binding protein [Tistlia consotensis USBA 355]SNS01294.1 peptide/nickel transport system substrate-binding protein [Tistlia consotensis]
MTVPSTLRRPLLAGLLLALPLLALAGRALPAQATTETYERAAVPLPKSYLEPDSLKDEVEDHALPPVAERLPKVPLVVDETADRKLGQYGGDLRMLVGRPKDSRLLSVYGYARLVSFDRDFELKPDILQKVEVQDGRIFTLYLRPGMRWSDGEPFTAEDFRYWWEDVANNKDFSPTGVPRAMIVDGQPATFEILDDYTVRYSWPEPNPFFLPDLAKSSPLFIYRPAHYLKQFHEKYGDAAFIAKMCEKYAVRSWAPLHNRLDDLYRFNNPDLPVLQPWMLTKEDTGQERIVAVRNPYFHRVDSNGRQLPYIDRFTLAITSPQLIPAKTASGEADLQARGINFSDYTFIKGNEKKAGYTVRLWDTVRGSEMALYPNLNVNDPVWRKLLRDVRFRRALSLATPREEINQVIYFGLGLPGNQSVLPASPLYDEHYRQAWAEFDPKLANKLLDEIGLTERGDERIRLMPDGRPLEIVVETSGENPQESDVLQLVADGWKKVGIKLFIKPSSREVLRNRVFSGDTVMSLWFGLENAIPSSDLPPSEFVPVQQASFQWPKWGQYYETKGRSGEPVDMEQAKDLMELYEKWLHAKGRAERREAWTEILKIDAEEVYTLGLVAKVPQPVVVTDRLKNVPEKAIYNWDPGAQFGVYHPDSFFFSGK